ncbi:hypothetical protein H4R18_000691 [Coemansia javaensis]|uniref:Prefoldin n=1 Tax=Coemansia javaensis TaxID=2761396 RepID=A0A9W8HIZ3_9FUNG|nr:hypothetical protein H4R18_000691 [Coemansia javaensis]
MADGTAQHVYLGLTQKIQSCQKQLGQIEAQLGANQRETRLAALTRREVEGLDDSVPLYTSLGKMFVQESRGDILRGLQATTNDAASLIQALEKKRQFVARELDEATAGLKDVVRQSVGARAAAQE